METFLFIVNLIGTVAFAAAGAMTGLQKNMDIFALWPFLQNIFRNGIESSSV